MTQPPYVPPRDDDSSTNPDYAWPPASETPAQQTPTTADPIYTEPTYPEPTYGDAGYVTPVSTGYVDTYTTNEDYATSGTSSTGDVAKEQAGNVKDTAVSEGQQVAGVAKEQAGAVKDTAVSEGQQVAGVAKEQAGAVKDTAVEQGQQVVGVVKEQVSNVASEASVHVKDLLSEGLAEVKTQAGSQQKRLAGGIHSLAGELGAMASKSEQSGPLTDYAQQLSTRGGEFGHWLENAEPSEVLDSLRSFARRRPVVFLAASALTGVLAGRLTRGLVANAKDERDSTPAVTSSARTPYTQDVPARENISLQEVPTSGTGSGYTTDAPDYVADDATLPYGTPGGAR